MHCPNCGKPSTFERYCRSCGMDLEPVGKLVTSHTGSDELKIHRAEAEKAVLQRMIKWMMWGFLVIGFGLVLLLTGKTFVLDPVVGLAASFLLLSGTGIAGYGLLAAIRDGASLKSTSSAPKNLPSAETTKDLPEDRIPLPLASVTERTTQLIATDEVRNLGE